MDVKFTCLVNIDRVKITFRWEFTWIGVSLFMLKFFSFGVSIRCGIGISFSMEYWYSSLPSFLLFGEWCFFNQDVLFRYMNSVVPFLFFLKLWISWIWYCGKVCRYICWEINKLLVSFSLFQKLEGTHNSWNVQLY